MSAAQSGRGGGPSLGATCTVCNHPQKAMIDAALTATRTPSYRKIAADFGLKHDAVRRHTMNHLVPASQAASPLGWQPPVGATWKEKMEALATALETGKVRSDVAAQLRLTYKDLDDAGDGGPVEVTVADVPGLADLLGEVFVALERFPQARDAFAAVLRARGFLREG